MGSMMEARYRGIRRHLDKLGYQNEALPLEALSLVQRILIDFGKTSDTLKTVSERADHFAKLVQEFEGGVEPFKEETVRLTKENSELRLGILRASEKADKDILANRSRLRDLECQNTDLKLLVKQFVTRLKELELESFHKTKRIADLQERNLEAVVISTDGERRLAATRKQRMEINCPAPPCCQHCIRIRNFVEYGGAKWKDPSALDYIKIADSRIECLQMQARCLKRDQRALTETIGVMEIKVEERDKEIDRLRHGIHTQPGGKMLLSTVSSKHADGDASEHALRMALKASQLQLNILHKRNIDLEVKLQESVLDGHHKFISGKASAAESRIIDSLVQSIDGGFPAYVAMSLEEKNKLLEAQLSHCCKEKAKLKLLLEQCESRHRVRRRSSPVVGSTSSKFDGVDDYDDFDERRPTSRSLSRTRRKVGFRSQPESRVISRSRSQTNGIKSRQSNDQVKQDQSKSRVVSQKGSGTGKASQSKQRLPPKTPATDSSEGIGDLSILKQIAEGRLSETGPTGDLQSRQDKEKTDRRDQLQGGRSEKHIGRKPKTQSENRIGRNTKAQSEKLIDGLKTKAQSENRVGGGQRRIQSKVQAGVQKRGQPKVPVGDQRNGRSDVERLESEASEDDQFEFGYSDDSEPTKGHSLTRKSSEELSGGLRRHLHDEEGVFEEGRARPGKDPSQKDDAESAEGHSSTKKASHRNIQDGGVSRDQRRAVDRPIHDPSQVNNAASAAGPSSTKKASSTGLARGPHRNIQDEGVDREQRITADLPRPTHDPSQVNDAESGEEHSLSRKTSEKLYGGLQRHLQDEYQVDIDKVSQPENREVLNQREEKRTQFEDRGRQEKQFQPTHKAGDQGQVERQSANPIEGQRQGQRQSTNPINGQRQGQRQSANPIDVQRQGQRQSANPINVQRQGQGQSANPIDGQRQGQSANPMRGREAADRPIYDPSQVDDAERANGHSLTRRASDELSGELGRHILDEGVFQQRGRVERSGNDPSQVDDAETSEGHSLTRKSSSPEITRALDRSIQGGGVHLEQGATYRPRPTYDTSQVYDAESTEGHSLSRRTSEELHGGLRHNLQDEYQVGNEKVSQSENREVLNQPREDRSRQDTQNRPSNQAGGQGQGQSTNPMGGQRQNGQRQGQSASQHGGQKQRRAENPTDGQTQAKAAYQVGSQKQGLSTKQSRSQTANPLDGQRQGQSTIQTGSQEQRPSTNQGRSQTQGPSANPVGDQGQGQRQGQSTNRLGSQDQELRPSTNQGRSQTQGPSMNPLGGQGQRQGQSVNQVSSKEQGLSTNQGRSQTQGPYAFGVQGQRKDQLGSQEQDQSTNQGRSQAQGPSANPFVGQRQSLSAFQVSAQKTLEPADPVRSQIQAEYEDQQSILEQALQSTNQSRSQIQGQSANPFFGQTQAESVNQVASQRDLFANHRPIQSQSANPLSSQLQGSSANPFGGQLQGQSVGQAEGYNPALSWNPVGSKEYNYEREIISLKSAIKVLDRDKDEMRVELDRKDLKIAKMQSEIGQYMEELARLNLRQQNFERQIVNNQESMRAQEHDLLLHRRKAEVSRRELEQMSRDREEALKELRRVTTTHSMDEIERKNISTELSKRNKEADDLRRQVHQYIEEVRRIEELLQAKDEEHEMILNQYRNLSAEKTTLEMHRTSLERETDTVRRSAREAMEHTSTLRSQLSRQNTLVKSYEEEIERLSNQVASLETQLSSARDSEQILNKDTSVAREYHIKMEKNLDDTRLKLADAESSAKQMEAENRDLRRHLVNLEQEISLANENYKKLDELLAACRENEFKLRRSIDERTAERNELKIQMLALTSRVDSLNDEFARSRLKCIELQTELDKLNRQLLHEKTARETASEELRRLQDSLNTSSTNMLLTRALDSGRRSPSPTPRLGTGISDESRLPFSRSLTPLQPNPSSPFTPSDPMDSPLAASTSRPPPDPQQPNTTSFADTADKYEPW